MKIGKPIRFIPRRPWKRLADVLPLWLAPPGSACATGGARPVPAAIPAYCRPCWGCCHGSAGALPGNGLRRELCQSRPACMWPWHPAKKPAGADGRRMPLLCTATAAAAAARLAHQQARRPARPPVRTEASVARGALKYA